VRSHKSIKTKENHYSSGSRYFVHEAEDRVHEAEDRVPFPLWQIIKTTGVDELADRALVEPIVFVLELVLSGKEQKPLRRSIPSEATAPKRLSAKASQRHGPQRHCAKASHRYSQNLEYGWIAG